MSLNHSQQTGKNQVSTQVSIDRLVFYLFKLREIQLTQFRVAYPRLLDYFQTRHEHSLNSSQSELQLVHHLQIRRVHELKVVTFQETGLTSLLLNN